MTGWTKLYESIVRSSVWSEDDKTRIMWITMMASADQFGHVTGSIPGMAAIARMTIAEAKKAINKLCGPDPYSQTPDKQGARLTIADGGWDIVNHAKYRNSADPERRRQQNRDAQERYRNKAKNADSKQIVSNSKHDVSENKHIAEAEAEADTDNSSAALTSKHKVLKRVEMEFDVDFWPNVPTKIGKGAARKAYIKARKKIPAETILTGLPKYQAYEDGRKDQSDYRPLHPATWINQERWADEIQIAETAAEKVARLREAGLL